MSDQRQLSAESGSVFREGIGLVLTRWSALQLAVENEWGGRHSREKANQLISDTFSWFTESTDALYIDDLEDMLGEALLSLNTEVDDGSIEEVAEKLIFMYEDCLDGNFQSIETLREANHQRVPVPHVEQVANEDEDDDEDGNIVDQDSSMMIVNAPQTVSNSNPADMVADESTSKPMAVADDGWEVVGSRQRRGKKN
ncbi:hypothetical protein UlMin_039734 [Ulmus minor]